MRKIIIGLLLTVAGIATLMLIPSKQAPAPMPWEITIMPNGKSKVFGIHLGTTTYGQAQKLFHEYGKTAIFTQENKPASVEAYFNSLNLGGLSAKLVLNLNLPISRIEEMTSRAMEARLQPSGAHLYQLSNSDNAELVNAPVIAITYIPSVRLNADMVRYRFGDATFIEQDINSASTKIWHYPELALTIRMDDGEKSVLQYQLH